MEAKIGFCKNCGRTMWLTNPKGETQRDWDREATEQCSCRKESKKKMHKEKLTLATLCGGAVQEKVDRALEKVARNILDPNVVQDKKRSVTLKLTLKPNAKDPEDVTVSADVSYTLSPEQGVDASLYVSKDIETGALSIMEHKKGEIKGQLSFTDVGITTEEEDFDPETGEITQDGVLDFRAAKEG